MLCQHPERCEWLQLMRDQEPLQQELPARLVASKALRAVAMLALEEGGDDVYMPLLRLCMEVGGALPQHALSSWSGAACMPVPSKPCWPWRRGATASTCPCSGCAWRYKLSHACQNMQACHVGGRDAIPASIIQNVCLAVVPAYPCTGCALLGQNEQLQAGLSQAPACC